MTGIMENSAKESDKPATADKEMGASGVQASDGTKDGKDNNQFGRERQLILLTALYKLYGEDWKESPDWVTVAEEIKSANIPNFADGFLPETWQKLYLSFFRKGYQVGIGPCATMHKPPSKLTPPQKRMWILAQTSEDLSRTSEHLDVQFRKTYKGEYETLKSLNTGSSDIKSQQVADALEVSPSTDSGEEKTDKEEYEDPEAAKVALEMEQAVLNKEILGFNDVLAMNKYCIDAVEHAIKAYPRSVEYLSMALERELNKAKAAKSNILVRPELSPSKIEINTKNIMKTPPQVISEKEKETDLLPISPPKSISTPAKAVEKEPVSVAVKPVVAVVNLVSPEVVTPETPKTPNKTVIPDVIEIESSPEKSPTKVNKEATETTGVQESNNSTTSNKCDSSELPKGGSQVGNGEEPADSQPLTTVTNVKLIDTPEDKDGKARGEIPHSSSLSKDLFGAKNKKKTILVKRKIICSFFKPLIDYPKRKRSTVGKDAVNLVTVTEIPKEKPKPEEIDSSSSREEEKGVATSQPQRKVEEGSAAATQAVVPPTKEVVDTPKSEDQTTVTKASEVENNGGEDLNKTVSSENSDIIEISPEKAKDDKQKEEVADKEKVQVQGQVQGQGNKKKDSSVRSTRTSSRLASPEPNDLLKQDNEEQKSSNAKKPGLSRQSSSSAQQTQHESPPHTPALRSRRGATPTKAVADVVAMDNLNVELRPRSSTPSKPSVPAVPPVTAAPIPTPATVPTPPTAIIEDAEEDTFETPRSTPESTEMGGEKSSDVESTNKPLKPVKVYSVKPPSPLSQVDPSLLDEFIDEDEDAELVEIDSNVNKAKGLKGTGSPSKSLALRGRTVSSENAMDTGGVQTIEDSAPSKRVTRRIGLNEDVEEDGTSNNEEGESKRLTRSSLKLHDAANEESTEAPQTESEKAASESSFGGKEKKPRTSKQLLRVKKLHDEKNRFYGEDSEETPDGKRLTRARARTSTSSTPMAEKRSKPPSVGDSEGLSESEPTPTRATRSRSLTTTNTPAPVEPVPSAATSAQISTVPNVDDEEQKNLRKTLLSLYDKIMASEAAAGIVKTLQDGQALISKWNADVAQIKKQLEHGAVSILGFRLNFNVALIAYVLKSPNSNDVREAAEAFAKLLCESFDELRPKPGDIPQPKNDNSDVESLESHDEQRSETSSIKQTPVGGGGGGGGGGARRKRKRSASETSEEVLPQENKRRVTRTSTSSSSAYTAPIIRKTKHPISPDIVSANRVRH